MKATSEYLRAIKKKKDGASKPSSISALSSLRESIGESQPNFTSIVKLLLAPLHYILQMIKQTSVAICNRDDAFDTLLAAPRVGDLLSRRSMLMMATKFSKDGPPTYRHVEMALQHSILSCLAGDYPESEQFIYDLCCGCGYHSMTCVPQFYTNLLPEQMSRTLKALHGHLHGLHLENLVQCEQYTAAIEQVDG